MLHQPILHPDGVVQGGGQAVQGDGPGPGVFRPFQGERPLRVLQFHGLARPEDPGQEGLRRLPVLRAAVPGEGGEAVPGVGGGVPGLPAGEADDGAVLQGGDGEGAPFPLPAQVPDGGQGLGQAAPEGLIGIGIQGQGRFHQGGDVGQAGVLGGLFRRGGGQGQRRQQGGGQGHGKQAFHGHPSNSCVVPLDGGGGKNVPAVPGPLRPGSWRPPGLPEQFPISARPASGKSSP